MQVFQSCASYQQNEKKNHKIKKIYFSFIICTRLKKAGRQEGIVHAPFTNRGVERGSNSSEKCTMDKSHHTLL